MSFSEKLRAESDEAVKDLKFSECLTEFLDHEERGPDESSGYTDKTFYYHREALLRRMDTLVERTN